MIEFITPVGRLVGGHPMKRRPITDSKTKQPVLTASGQPATDTYAGVAIPKTGVDWKQTDWGKLIYNEGVTGFPRGEYQQPTFAWKITDGDSAIPNKSGTIPNQKEGYPGHWILNCSTRFDVGCFHAGKYGPLDRIQNEKEIKPGDYCRVKLQVKPNESTQSPGVYLNPVLFELTRPGVEIILEGGHNAEEAFGGSAPQLPPGAQVLVPGAMLLAPPAGPSPMPPAPPAHDFLNGPPAPPAPPAEEKYRLNGVAYPKSQLVSLGYTDAHFATMQKA